MIHWGTSFLILALLCSCASMPSSKSLEVEGLFQAGAYKETIDALEKEIFNQKDENKLINYLNLALVYQLTGACRNSKKYFAKAEVLVNSNSSSYKLLKHESLMINFYRSINSICLGDIDGALVEMKKVDQKSYGESIEKTYFSNYLSGVLHESQEKYDEAFIDYKRVYEVRKYFPYLFFDIYRSLSLSGRPEKFSQYYKTNPKKFGKHILNPQLGEVVILLHSGIAPSISFDEQGVPQFTASGLGSETIQISVNGKDAGVAKPLVDLKELTKMNRKEYIEKFRESYFHKEGRSWTFLPEIIYIARIKAPEGVYKINLKNSSINKDIKIHIKKKSIHLLNLRDRR